MKTVPQGRSMVTTWAPTRSEISFSSSPKRPITGTSTVSPGSTSETIAASIADRDVPSTSIVAQFSVLKTVR